MLRGALCETAKAAKGNRPPVAASHMPFTIAIDGPAASGKGTLARRLAAALDLAHLDTGLTYRAVARAMQEGGVPLDDEGAAVRVAEALDLARLDRTVLARHEIGEAASRVAVMPRLREALVEAQRRFAARPGGAVLDGRDIGTVVCPHADLKLYVTASAEERARRRWNEVAKGDAGGEGAGGEGAGGEGAGAQGAGGGDGGRSFDDVLHDIRRRDARDQGREDSPLRPAPDAHLLDTTAMSIEDAFRKALDLAVAARPPAP